LIVAFPKAEEAGRRAAEVVDRDLEDIHSRLKPEFRALAGGRLLITGGAGFLGYYLVQSVLHWNRSVPRPRRIHLTVLDNYARGMPSWLESAMDEPALDLLEHDVREPLPASLPECDYVVHAASIASPTFYRRYPIQTMDANVDGLRRLLDHARLRTGRSRPVRGLLFFSTSEIYGDPDPANVPTPETYRGNVSCTGPRACYDESKRYGETLCVNFARVYGLPIRVARPFNNYGPGLKLADRRVIPDFARNVLEGKDIELLSDGSPTRTYCYVADAVVGYFKVLVRGEDGAAYNIGVDGPEISVAELAARMVHIAGELFGYRGEVVRRISSDPEYLTDNPGRRCPSIDKARSELDYHPEVSLDEGLRRTLLWYAEQRSAEKDP
jgi:UDP-glucuronate decarboxylase